VREHDPSRPFPDPHSLLCLSPRSGLINLDHPKAKAENLDDREEPIQVYLHALRHPKKGLFLVDSGVERALVSDPERAVVRGVVRSAAGVDRMRVRTTTADFLARQPAPPAGVLLTHLHLDHVLGLPDVPRGTPLYVGRGEARASGFLNVFVRSTTDRALEGHAPLREWSFQSGGNTGFAGVLDVLGDGSIWALHVPGHTPGSTAYLARTPNGPVLFVGDASHTVWGWDHGVEPGTFSSDQPESAESLKALQAFVKRHPGIDVRLGHQHRPHAEARAATPSG
jgi:glyoxylase-like metal-dependent hydrolase (beta-lactamase superfamily II)